MNQIECLREKLYEVIKKGVYSDILETSQELDKLIVTYMESHLNIDKKTA